MDDTNTTQAVTKSYYDMDDAEKADFVAKFKAKRRAAKTTIIVDRNELAWEREQSWLEGREYRV